MSVLSNRKRSILVSKAVNAAILVVTLLVVMSMAVVTLQAGDKASDDKAKKELIKKEQAKKEKAKKEQAEFSKGDFPAPDEFVKVEVYPEMIHQQAPEYPAKLKKAGIEGTVWIKALVDKTGVVRKAIAAKSTGEELLEKAAIAAAYENKFKPAIQKDKPVAVWVTYKVDFTLSEKDSPKSKN